MLRAVLTGGMLALSANALNAQITTYVAPPKPLAQTPQAIATADSIKRDSVSKATMTNMKAWVDSAAGVAVPQRVAVADSAFVADTGRSVVTTFSNGSVAPATASDLPTLAVLGVVVLAVGVGLLTYRSRS